MVDAVSLLSSSISHIIMCDLLLLLLLLLARCKTLWHHLFEVIINCLNDLQLGYNCRCALCVVTGVIAPRLLYLFLYLVRIMYIIMLYQVKTQPVCYTFYICSLNIYVLYIILIYALPYNGVFLLNFLWLWISHDVFYFRPSWFFVFVLQSGTHC